jgi:holo-[acyl-carrier protein] synthase
LSPEGVPRLVGVETSVVSVPRLARLVERFGDRLLDRLFTLEEQADARRKRRAAESLAARLAAKLAARRALGRIGLRIPRFREIEVRRRRSGEPALWLGAAHRDGREIPLRASLSLTHDADFALASLLLEEEIPLPAVAAGPPAASC